MLAIRNKLKRLFHSYSKLSFVSQHFVVTLAPFRLSFSRHYVYYFSPTLPLSFSHHCILISRPSVCHFSAIVFIFFPPLHLSLSRHYVCHFPATAFFTFLPPNYVFHFPAIAFVSRHSPAVPAITFVISFVTFPPVRWSFFHLVAITFFTSRLRVCPELKAPFEFGIFSTDLM